MGLRFTAFWLVSLLSYVILMTGTVINEVLMPFKANFFYTHWILGRLTGLWELDVFVDTMLVSIAIGLLAVLWVNIKLR